MHIVFYKLTIKVTLRNKNEDSTNKKFSILICTYFHIFMQICKLMLILLKLYQLPSTSKSHLVNPLKERPINIQIDNCLENQIMIFMSKKLGILSTIYTRESKLAHV